MAVLLGFCNERLGVGPGQADQGLRGRWRNFWNHVGLILRTVESQKGVVVAVPMGPKDQKARGNSFGPTENSRGDWPECYRAALFKKRRVSVMTRLAVVSC